MLRCCYCSRSAQDAVWPWHRAIVQADQAPAFGCSPLEHVQQAGSEQSLQQDLVCLLTHGGVPDLVTEAVINTANAMRV